MKTVLITGGSEGIGYAFAKYFAEEKASLILVGRNREKLDQAKNELEQKYDAQVQLIQQDLSQKGAALAVYEKLQGMTVDILINNAGLGLTGVSWENDGSVEEDMLLVNDVAMMSFCRVFLKEMTARRQGIVINVGSTGAFQPGPYIAGYYASKSFTLSYTKAIREEAKPYGVRVYCLCPGPVKTAFYERSGLHAPEMAMSAEDVVAYTMKHLGRKCVIIPGVSNRIMALLPAAIKTPVIAAMKKKVLKKR